MLLWSAWRGLHLLPFISNNALPFVDPSSFNALHTYIPASFSVAFVIFIARPCTVLLVGSESFSFDHVSCGTGKPLVIQVNFADSPIFILDFCGMIVTLGASNKRNMKMIAAIFWLQRTHFTAGIMFVLSRFMAEWLWRIDKRWLCIQVLVYIFGKNSVDRRYHMDDVLYCFCTLRGFTNQSVLFSVTTTFDSKVT